MLKTPFSETNLGLILINSLGNSHAVQISPKLRKEPWLGNWGVCEALSCVSGHKTESPRHLADRLWLVSLYKLMKGIKSAGYCSKHYSTSPSGGHRVWQGENDRYLGKGFFSKGHMVKRGGLDENKPHRCLCVNAWCQVGATVWEGFRRCVTGDGI